MSKKNNEPVDDRTISISGSSVELQSLSGKEGSEKTKKQDSNLTGNEVSASINLDQTIGMDAALQKTLQEKEEIPEEKQESPKFSPAGYSNLVEIGKGGMGKIYKAKQDSLQRNVAIKVMHFPDDKEGVQRFMMEASILAQLDHPNIIRVFDFGQSDGMMFLVMELIDGDTLKQHVIQHQVLSVQDFILIAKQLAGAILESHRQNIVHRDIKPSNVLLKIRDDAMISKLIDFGLVKNLSQNLDLSRTGTVLGSPLYMSPEQLLSDPIDDRTDIYSLGLTFYFILTGQPPYKDKEILALFRSQLEREPDKMSISRPELEQYPAVMWLVETMIQKKPENRFQNAQQLKEAIQMIEKMMITGEHTSLAFVDGKIVPAEKIDPLANTITGSQPVAEIASSIDNTISPMSHDENKMSIPLGNPSNNIETSNPSISNSSGGVSVNQVEFSKQDVLESSNPHMNNPEISQSFQVNPVQQPKSQLPIFLFSLVMFAGMFFYFQQRNTQEMEQNLQMLQENQRNDVEILLSSEPIDAEIYNGTSYIGQTPQTFNLKADEKMLLTLKKDGYEDRDIEITSKITKPSIKLQKSPIKAEKKEVDTKGNKVQKATDKSSKTIKPSPSSKQKKSVPSKSQKSPSKVQEKKTNKLKNNLKDWD